MSSRILAGLAGLLMTTAAYGSAADFFFDRAVDSESNRRPLASMWGGGELTGVTVVIELPVAQVSAVLAREGLEVGPAPAGTSEATRPVMIVFGQQVGVRALSHNMYDQYISNADRARRLNYDEMAILIPGAIYRDRENGRAIEVTAMPLVLLTNQFGAGMDRTYLGYNMISDGVAVTRTTGAFELSYDNPKYEGLDITNFRASYTEAPVDLHSLERFSSMNFEQPIISFPVGTDGRPKYPFTAMYSAMVMDVEALARATPVRVDLKMDGRMLPGLEDLNLKGVIGFSVNRVPWVLTTHHWDEYSVLSHPFVEAQREVAEKLMREYQSSAVRSCRELFRSTL